LTLQVANLSLDLDQLILGQLQLGLRLQTHVLHMDLIGTVLLLDVVHLELRVHMNLLDRFFILTGDGLNLLMTIGNLIQFLLHVGLVRLLLRLHLLLVLATLHVHLLLEQFTVLVLASLKLLEEGGVFEHF